MAAGKLAQACEAFEASNRAEASAGTLIRLGECREQNHQLASAVAAYRHALGRAKDQRKRAFATGRITELEPQLSTLTIAVPEAHRLAGLTVARGGDSVDATLWNQPQPIDGEDYVISATAPDHQAWQTTVHVAASGAQLTVEVPQLAPLRPPVAASQPQPTAEPAVSTTDQRPSLFTPRRKIAAGVAGATLISLVAAIALGSSADGKQNDAFKLCPDAAMPCAQASQSNALIQLSHSRAHEANIAWGFAAVTAAAAGILWFTGAPDERAAAIGIAPSVSANATGILVMGRF